MAFAFIEICPFASQCMPRPIYWPQRSTWLGLGFYAMTGQGGDCESRPAGHRVVTAGRSVSQCAANATYSKVGVLVG